MLVVWSHTLLAGAGMPDGDTLKNARVKLLEQPVPVPGVVFKDIGGGQVALDQFRGNVVMLNFWATWCAPCVKEMPMLDDLQEDYGERGLRVVAISQDQGAGDKEVAKAIHKFYYENDVQHLPVFVDGVANAYSAVRATGLPTTLVIDRQGRERMRVTGMIDWESEEFRGWLEGLLAE